MCARVSVFWDEHPGLDKEEIWTWKGKRSFLSSNGGDLDKSSQYYSHSSQRWKKGGSPQYDDWTTPKAANTAFLDLVQLLQQRNWWVRGRWGEGDRQKFSRPLFVVSHRFVFVCFVCFVFCLFEEWKIRGVCFVFVLFWGVWEMKKAPRGQKHGQKRICRVKGKKWEGTFSLTFRQEGRKRKRDECVVMKCNGD